MNIKSWHLLGIGLGYEAVALIFHIFYLAYGRQLGSLLYVIFGIMSLIVGIPLFLLFFIKKIRFVVAFISLLFGVIGSLFFVYFLFKGAFFFVLGPFLLGASILSFREMKKS